MDIFIGLANEFIWVLSIRCYRKHQTNFWPTLKKAEHQRINAFELWCWRRLLRVSWTARKSKQSILKEINSIFIGRTDAEAKAPILWSLDAKNWLTGKEPAAGKIEGRRRGRQRIRLDGSPIQWTWVWAISGRYWRTEKPGALQSMGSQRGGHSFVTEQYLEEFSISQRLRVRIPRLRANCVTLGKLHKILGFNSLTWGGGGRKRGTRRNITYIMELLWELIQVMNVKCLEQGRAQSKNWKKKKKKSSSS